MSEPTPPAPAYRCPVCQTARPPRWRRPTSVRGMVAAALVAVPLVGAALFYAVTEAFAEAPTAGLGPHQYARIAMAAAGCLGLVAVAAWAFNRPRRVCPDCGARLD